MKKERLSESICKKDGINPPPKTPRPNIKPAPRQKSIRLNNSEFLGIKLKDKVHIIYEPGKDPVFTGEIVSIIRDDDEKTEFEVSRKED